MAYLISVVSWPLRRVVRTSETWKVYGRIFADWMDIADLGVFDRARSIINRYSPGKEIRQRRARIARSRGGIQMPRVQYAPVETVAERLADVITSSGATPLNWSGLKTSTRNKALATLEDFGFIEQKATSIVLLPKMQEFARHPERRAELLADAVRQLPAFTTFEEVLESHAANGCRQSQLATELKEKLDVAWTDGTAQVNSKIMLDWARRIGTAPDAFALRRRKAKSTV